MLNYDDLVELARLCARNSRIATSRDVADELWRMAKEYQEMAAKLGTLPEIDGESVGIGAIVVSKSELRACYVAPHAARRGVGTALVAEIERLAREHHLDHLQLESSTTAEPFSALGYQVERRGEHRLSSGVSMAAVKMRKPLE